MLIPLPPGLKKQCKFTELSIKELCPEGLQTERDIVRYLINGKSNFMDVKRRQYNARLTKGAVENYFFIKEDFENARKILYYSMVEYAFTKNREIENVGFMMMFRGGNEKYLMEEIEYCEKYLKGPVEGEYYSSYISNYFVHFYLLCYQFFKNHPEYKKMTLRMIENLKSKYKEDNKEYKVWHTKLYYSFLYYEEYALWLLTENQLNELRETMKDYFKLLDYFEYKKPSYNFSILSYFPFKPFMYVFKNWFAALDNPDKKEYYAKEAMKAFYRWFTVDKLGIEGSPHKFSFEILLSIVMRIDLGLDTETCKSFVRYFKPYIEPFSHIREKVEALKVEYEPPVIPPDTELRKIFEEEKQYADEINTQKYQQQSQAWQDKLNQIDSIRKAYRESETKLKED